MNSDFLYNIKIVPDDIVKLFIILFISLIFYRQLNKNKVFPFLLINQFIGIIMIFISLFIIEKGIYLFELETQGFYNYAFYFWTFFVLIWLYIIVKQKSLKFGTLIADEEPKIFLIFYFCYVIFTYFYTGGVEPSSSSKASIFARDVGITNMTLLMKVLTFSDMLINFAIKYYTLVSRKKYFLILMVMQLLNAIYNISLSSLMDLSIIYLIRFAMINKTFKIRYRYIVLFSVFVFIRIFYRYESLAGSSVPQLLFLIQRFAMQGQLFWISIHESYNGDLLTIISSFWNNFISLRNAPLNTEYGLGHFMYSVSPNVAEEYINDGISFTAGSPGIFIYYFGMMLGSIIYVCITLLIMKLLHFYLRIIYFKNILLFISFSLVLEHFTLYYLMGDATRMNLRFVFYILVFLLLYYGTIQDFFMKTIRNVKYKYGF